MLEFKTQTQKLARHFRIKGEISPYEARDLYQIDSFHRRLSDLKDQGWRFMPVSKWAPNGKRYTRYYLSHDPAQGAA